MHVSEVVKLSMTHLTCFPNKTEDLNIHVSNKITGINKSKTLTKNGSCKCEHKVYGSKCYLNQKWSNNKCWWEYKNHHICEKDYPWNPAICSFENGKCLSFIDTLMITCDEIKDTEEKVAIPTNYNDKKSNLWNTKFLYFSCLFIHYQCIIDSY